MGKKWKGMSFPVRVPPPGEPDRPVERNEVNMYRITTDSTCDLPQAFYQERGIAYIGLSFQLDGRNIRRGLTSP